MAGSRRSPWRSSRSEQQDLCRQVGRKGQSRVLKLVCLFFVLCLDIKLVKHGRWKHKLNQLRKHGRWKHKLAEYFKLSELKLLAV